MTAHLVGVVRKEEGVRSRGDHRRRVNRLTLSYKDDDGVEYRTRAEFPTTFSLDEMMAHVPKTIDR